MELSFVYNITFGCFTILLLMFLLRCYWAVRRKFSGFPVSHFFPYFVYCLVTGKSEKDVPLTSIIFRNIVDVAKQHIKEGLVMGYTTRPCLFIFSEDSVKFFLNNKAVMDKSAEYMVLEKGIGKGIGISNGERWRKNRKIINPTFHIGMLKERVPQFNKHASALVKDLELPSGNPSTTLIDAIKYHYFNTLSESIFGLKQDEEHKEENLKFLQLMDAGSHIAIKLMFFPWLQWKLFTKFFPSGRNYSRIIKNYRKYVEKVISDMKKFVISNKTIDASRFDTEHLKKSFTYIILNRHLNDPTFTFEDVYGGVSPLFIGGYDTVSYATLWCIFLLGLHPEVQENAFNEIQLKTGSYVTYEDSCNLTYLELVIMETLRLYPVAPIFGRNLSEDVQFDKYNVSRNTSILFFPYILHRNPDIYPNPEKFYPERFLNAETKKTYKFIPFSDGIRNCIGQQYAIIAMKIFLAHIIQNFKITSCERREDISLCWNLVLTPAKPPNVILTPRQGK